MEFTTTLENGNIPPERWCAACGEVLGDATHLLDGDLVCPPCWHVRRMAEEQEQLDEAEAELESIREEMDDAEAAHEEDMARLRQQRRTWQRRADAANGRLLVLQEAAAAVEAEAARPAPTAADELRPILGGAPFEPTAEDWEDYRAWAADLAEREMREAEADRDRRADETAPYGYED